VSQFTGHGDLVQQTEEQEAVDDQRQQPPAGVRDEADRPRLVTLLTAAGVAPSVAAGLVTEHPAELVRDAVEASL